MAFPVPQLGLVVSYAYVWHHEYRAGREEGTKNRPCVIVLTLQEAADGSTLARVVPVTHSPPGFVPRPATAWPPSAQAGIAHYRKASLTSWVWVFCGHGCALRLFVTLSDHISWALGFAGLGLRPGQGIFGYGGWGSRGYVAELVSTQNL